MSSGLRPGNLFHLDLKRVVYDPGNLFHLDLKIGH